MAHNTSHRRILANPDPQTPMDPTLLRKPKPNPSSSAAAARNRHHPPPPLIHPVPDPDLTPPPSTIQNISSRFSKLYANHKKLVSQPSKPGPHPQPDPHFQTLKKSISFSPVSDSSCTALSKSSSQRERNTSFTSAVAKILEKNEKSYYLGGANTKVGEKDGDFKKPSSEKDPKNSSFEALLMSKGLGIEEGLLNEGNKRRSSLSSIPPVVNGGGRRKSFCNSQVELADFLACSGVKVVAVDMPPFMQIHAVDCARKSHDSLEKFTSKTLAYTLKKEFDGVYGPAWHCIVGTSFGSFVTHSVGGFMYFSMDHKLYILLFKTTVQRAE